MLISEGDLFRLNKDYLYLDRGTLCKCLEDIDLCSDFYVLSETSSGKVLIPVEYVGYSQGDLAELGVDDELIQ